jgi:hypothetical protein
MKTLCRQDASAGLLGGKKVAEKNFSSQTFEEVAKSFRDPNGDGELIEVYEHDCNRAML